MNTSVSASPNKFQQKINSQTTIIGAKSCSGWFLRTDTLAAPLPVTSLIIIPKLGLGGCTPNPKKLKIISVPATAPKPKVAETIIGVQFLVTNTDYFNNAVVKLYGVK